MHQKQDLQIVCGRDGRPHSPSLQQAFINGFRSQGGQVTQLNLVTTPLCYHACIHGGFDGSAMITASHNSGEYNGIKLTRDQAIPISYEGGLNQIEQWAKTHAELTVDFFAPTDEMDPIPEYLNFLQSKATFASSFRFAIDCGNGMGGFLAEKVIASSFQERGLDQPKVTPLYWDLDFSFPNHLANPLDFRNLVDLQQAVRQEHLDFGVAFDGDADRCFFVDNRAEVVPADMLTALLAEHYLRHGGPSAIVYDVRSSRAVHETILRHGGQPFMGRVGHSYMKELLREKGGIFGGELAGHFYFRDFSYADSAFLTMIAVMNVLDEQQQSLYDLLKPYRIYACSGEINFETMEADRLIEGAAALFPNGMINRIDGLRLDQDDWWFCLRKSNTEPLLRLVAEARNQATLDQHLQTLLAYLKREGATPH
jgi:phosphomannomutase